jgi:hypothetical protein
VEWAATATAVLLWYAVVVLGGLRQLRASDEKARIVPYFERAVSGIDTFYRSGYALARCSRYLDEIACQAGLTPLSAFGFRDNFSFLGEWVRWHDAGQGLATVDALVERLHESPGLVPEPEAVIADLERRRWKLEAATRLQVRSCFHLQMDWAYSGLEFEQRRGKY